ncbi:hypothetical protein B4U79_16888 [Dinothrombium tinctorium]|uniref:N-acetyltransferase domain-containing protein n=1 Tax=Dinothrombium tinctorium TaxID=1965070 RepID=A0A3S4Q8W8_9ACAR|nr:hypothetical protein B4U79_16888 [Dinothrombium tinctorium]
MNRGYKIRQFTPDDIEEVAFLSAKTFTEKEATAKAIGATFDEYYREASKKACEVCAKEPLSFVCVDDSLPNGQKIIGFRLCKTFSIDPPNSSESKIAIISHFMIDIAKKWLQKHPEYAENKEKQRKVLSFLGLVVKTGYEGLNIATDLCLTALKHAKTLGYQYAVTVSTAEASQHLFANKLHFKEYYSVDFDDYELNGEKPFYGVKKPKSIKCYEFDLNLIK